ncbi:MAG: adenylate/guanylate cyclase domain-containing protein [Pseudomonadota bacterium]
MRSIVRGLVAVLFAALMLAIFVSPVGRMLEREYGLPLLYSVRGDLPPPPEAMVIGLDNASVGWLNAYVIMSNRTSPRLDTCLPDRAREDLMGAANINHIPRSVHACLLDELTARGAEVVAFDINFNKERPDDALLAAALGRAGNVLLFERFDQSPDGMIQRRQPRPMFRDGALGTMAFHVDSARGEIATSYATRYGGTGLRAMPEKVWEVFTGQTLPSASVDSQPIWLYGPPGTIPTVPLAAMFDPALADLLPQDLSGMVVFVGSSDPDDPGIDDHFPVPTSPGERQLIGGVELAATAFLNLLHGTLLDRLDPQSEWAIVFFVALAGGVVVLTQTRWRLMGSIAVISIGYLAVAIVAFSEFRIWLPVTVPVFLTAALVCLAAVSVRYFFVRALVGRLAPRPVADMLLQGTVADRKAAKSEVATIIFTDLVGSTALAEQMDEVAYTAAINRYYDAATEVIEQHGGMVVEFMGDGIVSMFSESVTGPDHAAKGCAAVKALVERMTGGDAEHEGDAPEFRLRVGINTGITATGHIGARHRFSFKALGDVVNVAARLEQMGKDAEHAEQHTVLLSETTRAAAGLEPAQLEPLGSVSVRGRAESVAVFRLPIAVAG